MASATAAERAAQVAAAIGKAAASERRHELVTAITHYEKALALATSLYEADSLVVACANLVLVPQRWNLSHMPQCSAAETAKQMAACAANLAAGHDVLDARRAAGTLTVTRPDEAVFEAARRGALAPAVAGLPFAPPPELHTFLASLWVPHFGYICALWGAIGCFAMLSHSGSPYIGPAGTARYQKALLDALDMIAVMRGSAQQPPGLCNQEISVADQVQDFLSDPEYRAGAFGAKLAASWERQEVRGKLQQQGLPSASAAVAARYDGENRQAAARVAARGGLRACGLESCGARELHVAHFKVCGRCKSVAYCSAEHGAEDWRAGHKRRCKELAEAAAKSA